MDNRIARIFSSKSVYLFSNENITDGIGALGDIRGKNILSVGAGGDHAFGAYLAGASLVKTFDINPSQSAIIDLKTCMIHNVSYENFIDFFFSSKDFFSPKIIRDISSKMTPNARRFIRKYEKYGARMFAYGGAQHQDYKTTNIPYLTDSDAYLQLRSVLPKKINFTHCDIGDICTLFGHNCILRRLWPHVYTYDVILLSNIYDYIMNEDEMCTLFYLSSRDISYFYHRYLSPMSHQVLAPDGRIVFRYLWNINPESWHKLVEIYDLPDRRHSLEFLEIPSNQKDTNFDGLLMLKQHSR